jgi:hypothetical protein
MSSGVGGKIAAGRVQSAAIPGRCGHEKEGHARCSRAAHRAAAPAAAALAVIGGVTFYGGGTPGESTARPPANFLWGPREPIDTSGFETLDTATHPWDGKVTLDELCDLWQRRQDQLLDDLDRQLAAGNQAGQGFIDLSLAKASLLNALGRPEEAYEALAKARGRAVKDRNLTMNCLATIVYFQGVSALRRGETENCIMCRGECSCILPIAPAAVHTNPAGSRLAVQHFLELLGALSDRSGSRLAAECGAHGPRRASRQGRSSLPHHAGSVPIQRA